MNRRIRRLTSLDNLTPPGNNRGQVATLLILATVVLLIFAMVTLNLGNVAVTSTSLSNAADIAALYLASQLATTSRQLFASLDYRTRQCQSTGWASMVLSVLGAIVAIIAAPFTGGASLTFMQYVVLGAAGGAIGGAAGGAIVHGDLKGAAMGALQGAAIGAAIGMGAAGLAGAPMPGAEMMLSPELASVMGSATLTPIEFAGAAQIAMGSLSLAAAGYNESVAQQIPAEVAHEYTKMMNKMRQPDRIRESTFMRALQLVVDDPTKSYDSSDSNFNGDTLEMVPDFQIWLFNRIQMINSVSDAIVAEPIIYDFLNNYCWQFANVCELVNEGGDAWLYVTGAAAYVGQPGPLERRDYKWISVPAPTDDNPEATSYEAQSGRDGHVVKLLRGLHNAGRPVSFWRPGPTPTQMNQWGLQCTGDVCIDPPTEQGYDALDAMADNLLEGRDFINALRSLPQNDTIAAWRGWAFFFYDEYWRENPAAYLNRTLEYSEDIGDWITELETVRTSLPACLFGGEGGQTVLNAPCQFGSGGSIDSDPDDDFYNAYYDLAGTQGELRNFHLAINGFFSALFPELDESAYEQLCVPPDSLNPSGKSCGGKNPVSYRWRDSRGDHEVTVKAVFNVPRLRNYKTGNWFKGKVCVELLHGAENTQVIVSRWDSSKSMGALGTWNPFGGRVTKAARAYYNYNRDVRLVD